MEKAKVIVVKSAAASVSFVEKNPVILKKMLEIGLRFLTGQTDSREGLRRYFSSSDRVGIKINTIGGKAISTRPVLSVALASWLSERNLIKEGNITIWDRTNRELKDAGYRLSTARNGLKIFGTDTGGVGYGQDLIIHRSVGSLLSVIQGEQVTASISLAILKDHGLAGVTAGLKNYFGAIHNPNKYHDNGCDPFVAEVFDAEPVKSKHRLSILDCLTVQYHRGPSFHPQWADNFGGLVISDDPVAADAVGWRIIEELRAKKGLPSLAEERRKPKYLATAEKMGLGRADLKAIDLIEERL